VDKWYFWMQILVGSYRGKVYLYLFDMQGAWSFRDTKKCQNIIVLGKK
jgi:hypothetical protein